MSSSRHPECRVTCWCFSYRCALSADGSKRIPSRQSRLLCTFEHDQPQSQMWKPRRFNAWSIQWARSRPLKRQPWEHFTESRRASSLPDGEVGQCLACTWPFTYGNIKMIQNVSEMSFFQDICQFWDSVQCLADFFSTWFISVVSRACGEALSICCLWEQLNGQQQNCLAPLLRSYNQHATTDVSLRKLLTLGGCWRMGVPKQKGTM